MDAFIQKFCEKYSLPIALSLQLLDNMEKFTFHKGDFLVQEGGRNSNFYIVSKGIWRGHYLNDGVDVSVWFASEGEAIFSSWGYVENTSLLFTLERDLILGQNCFTFSTRFLDFPVLWKAFVSQKVC